MFDAVADTRPAVPQAQIDADAELPPYDPVLYLIHIATVPPDKATRPVWNNNAALDNVNWSSLPAELHKVCLLRAISILLPRLLFYSGKSDTT